MKDLLTLQEGPNNEDDVSQRLQKFLTQQLTKLCFEESQAALQVLVQRLNELKQCVHEYLFMLTG